MAHECERAVVETVQVLYADLFPNLTPDQMMDKLRGSGLHHRLLEIAIPQADFAVGDEYGYILDAFEAELAGAIEQTYELMLQARKKKRRRRR